MYRDLRVATVHCTSSIGIMVEVYTWYKLGDAYALADVVYNRPSGNTVVRQHPLLMDGSLSATRA